MTLLASVNRVLRDLREDDIDTLTSDEKIVQIVDALNREAGDHLRAREWAFLKRYDGYAFFPQIFEATTGLSASNMSTTTLLNVFSANAWSSTQAVRFTTRTRAKLRITNSAEFPNTSFVITDLSTSIHFPAELSTEYNGVNVGADGAFEVYTHEYVLPSTVRQVLSTFDQEGPIDLVFVDRDTDFDQIMIRSSDYRSNRPSVCFAGGVYTASALNGAAAVSGLGLMIWPPCTSDVYVQYSYIHQHADLVDDADEWGQVPAEHVSYIEKRAFEYMLRSNRQADPNRAIEISRDNGRTLARLEGADDRQPRRRMAMQPFQGGSVAQARARWASQSIAGP